jgi:hypothetical protein
MLALAKANAPRSALGKMRFINSDIQKVEIAQQYQVVVAFRPLRFTFEHSQWEHRTWIVVSHITSKVPSPSLLFRTFSHQHTFLYSTVHIGMGLKNSLSSNAIFTLIFHEYSFYWHFFI